MGNANSTPANPTPANPTPSERYNQQAPTVAADNRRLTTHSGTVLLARFSQLPETHQSLRFHLLSDASKANIYTILQMPCTTYTGGAALPPTVDKLGELNIRFASFYVKIKTTSDSSSVPIISAYLIPTIPVYGFAVINLLAIYGTPIYNNCQTPGGVLPMLFAKILHELKVLGYDLTGRGSYNHERPSSLLINCDIYYDRSNSQGGHFHRDISPISYDAITTGLRGVTDSSAAIASAARAGTNASMGTADADNYVATVVEYGNKPQNVSLEFFSPEGDVFLGPEFVKRNTDLGESLTDRFSDEVLRTEVEHGNRSLRVLVTDGTTILFNNFAAIHATPITQYYAGVGTNGLPLTRIGSDGQSEPIFGSPFHDDMDRLEVYDPNHPAVVITRDNPRTFLRTWIAEAPLGFNIKDYPNERINGYTALQANAFINAAVNASNPNIVFQTLEPYQIFGGSTISSYKNESKKNNSTLLKPEYNLKGGISNKTESNNLVNFKILGDPKNPIIKINCDVPFEEIKGPENIEKYKLKEIEFAKKLVNQKGGKNNRIKHKKTYNRKTKKIRKTNKAKKYRKNTKSKRSKK